MGSRFRPVEGETLAWGGGGSVMPATLKAPALLLELANPAA